MNLFCEMSSHIILQLLLLLLHHYNVEYKCKVDANRLFKNVLSSEAEQGSISASSFTLTMMMALNVV